MPTYAVLDGGQVVSWREIADWDSYPAHKKAANDERGDGGPVLRLRVAEGSGPIEQVIIEPTQVRVVRSTPQPPPAPTWSELTTAQKQQRVNVERDRRISKFTFNGIIYDYDPASSDRIDKARGSALAAIIAGAQPNDLRWADPNIDFGWIAADNSFNLMDAPTTLAFGNAAAAWEGLHIVAARNLKDMATIPENYADDQYWPTA